MVDEFFLEMARKVFQVLTGEMPFEQPYGDLVDGPIKIGTVKQTNASFGLELSEINEHVFLTGRPGSGKTTIVKLMMKQLPVHGVTFWAFDFKQDCRPLARDLELYVLNWKNLKFNPLRSPPGCDARIWMQAFLNVFAQSYYLQVGTKELLLASLDRLFVDYGVYDGSDAFPSLHDLLSCLEMGRSEKSFGRESGFLESAKNRVRGTVLSLFEMFDCDKGFPIEHLLGRNVVLELDGLLYENQIFLVNIMLRYIFQYRISQKHRGSLAHVIFFDEGKMVYDASRDFIPGLGVNEVTQFTTQIREFKTGLIVIDQMPTMISESVKGSVYTMMGMSQSGGKNFQEMARAMNLNQEQLDFMTQLVSDKSLNLYEALVKINGRWTQPFAIEVIPSHFERSISDYEVESRMRRLLEDLYRHVTPRTPYEKILIAKRHQAEKREPPKQEAPKERTKEDVEGNILIKILTNIKEQPFIDQKERIAKLGLGSSSSTADKYFKELVLRGLVNAHKVGLGRGKGIMLLYEITEKGMDYARMNRFTMPGKGNFVHKFWQHIIATFYRNLGCESEVEKRFGSKNVDVGIQIENKKLAVEIELSPDHLMENVTKDLEAGCDEVIVAASSQTKADSYKKKIREHDEKLLGKVEMKVLSEFLD